MSFLMDRLWFKIRKQPRPVLLHEVPEFVGHQRGVNIRPFDKAADARQLLRRKIIVSTHGADDSRTRLGLSQFLSLGGLLWTQTRQYGSASVLHHRIVAPGPRWLRVVSHAPRLRMHGGSQWPLEVPVFIRAVDRPKVPAARKAGHSRTSRSCAG